MVLVLYFIIILKVIDPGTEVKIIKNWNGLTWE